MGLKKASKNYLSLGSYLNMRFVSGIYKFLSLLTSELKLQLQGTPSNCFTGSSLSGSQALEVLI